MIIPELWRQLFRPWHVCEFDVVLPLSLEGNTEKTKKICGDGLEAQWVVRWGGERGGRRVVICFDKINWNSKAVWVYLSVFPRHEVSVFLQRKEDNFLVFEGSADTQPPQNIILFFSLLFFSFIIYYLSLNPILRISPLEKVNSIWSWIRGGEGVRCSVLRVKWGRRAVPLRGDQPPTYNPWWARWGLGLWRWAGGGERTIPFKFNLCWCAASVELLAVIVILQGGGRWKTREPKYRQLDSWLDSLIEREVNCSQSWICTRCTFLHRRASWRGNMHRGFLGEFLSSDFFLPALSEWWPTQSTSSLNFSKDWINFRKQRRPPPPRWISSLSYLLQAHPRPHNCEIVAQTALFRSRRGCLSLRQVLVARDASLPDRNWGPSNTLPLAPLAGRDFMVRTFSRLIHVGGTVKCPPSELKLWPTK